MVIAGPGTGKTQILTLRIAQILEKTQIDPQNILALTFSESGAFEMRKRLSEIIGTPAFRVEIATFHSFCNDIIKNYPESFPNLLSFESITEVEQIEIVEKIIGDIAVTLLRPFGKPLHYVKEIKNSINDLKKEGVSALQLKEGLIKQKKDFEKISDLYHEKGKYKGEMKGKYLTLQKQMEKAEEFVSVYTAYEAALVTEKKYDFNDMLLGVVKELESNTSLLLQIQEKYQYILVDEHQDTNATQNKLLELLSNFHEIPNLFVVGDEKQAIYRFQGASLENFLYFQKLYPGAKLIYLDQNYRSQQHILDASAEMISKNVSAHILPVKNQLTANVSHPLEAIKVVALPNFFDEYSFIAADIEKKKEAGTLLSQIAILGRRNNDLVEMAHILQRKKILFSQDADGDIFADIQMQKLLLLFAAIHDLGNDVLLGKILQIFRDSTARAHKLSSL
jgi:DNA helicase-2/ATP-dependent DNA helicase PcrA